MSEQPKEHVWTIGENEHPAHPCESCGRPLSAGELAVSCPRCKGLHHFTCWTGKGGCSTHGCFQLADPNNINTADLQSKLQAAMHQPEKIQFRQTVEARGILGSYRWSAVISRSEGHTQVQASGAPGFFSSDLLADFSDFGKAMANFSLEYKETVTEEATPFLLVRYTRKPGIKTGAIDGRLWIDPKSYLIKRIEARYTWGTAIVDQKFTTISGYVVLAKQNATLSPLAMRVTFTYSDYVVNR